MTQIPNPTSPDTIATIVKNNGTLTSIIINGNTHPIPMRSEYLRRGSCAAHLRLIEALTTTGYQPVGSYHDALTPDGIRSAPIPSPPNMTTPVTPSRTP